MSRNIIIFVFLLFIVVLKLKSYVYADWPMAGHDPQRSSYASEDEIPDARTPIWHVTFESYIPSKAHLITVDRSSTDNPSMVYVPTDDGVYALDSQTGEELWHYPTTMPVGHSPTVVDDVMYIPVMDKTIHAVNALDGQKIWQTDRAGGGFTTSPLVINGIVYAGSHDGYFYAFNKEKGAYIWSVDTGGPIRYSAAYDDETNTIYFASNDMYAYAVDSTHGTVRWKQGPFPGDGFTTYWPVVFQDRVVFSRSANYPSSMSQDLNQTTARAVFNGEPLLFPTASLAGVSDIDATRFSQWLTEDPDRQTVYVLDKTTGEETDIAPILWWGNSSGNRYPPVVGPENRLWFLSMWNDSSWFGGGRYAGWVPGSHQLRLEPAADSGTESADEPEAISIVGTTEPRLYHTDGGDGADKGGVIALNGGYSNMWTWFTYYNAFGDYTSRWRRLKYGLGVSLVPSDPWGSTTGTHGYQNPPVPLGNKVYFHRSNTVICLSP